MLQGKKLVEYYDSVNERPHGSELVHVIWLSAGFVDQKVPDRFHANKASLSVGFPTRTQVQWLNSDARVLICAAGKESFFYGRLKTPVERSDYLRMLVLHRFAGVYADVDMRFMECAEGCLDDARPVNLVPSPLFSECFQSCLLVANAAGHRFWEDVASMIESNVLSLDKGGSGKPVELLLSIPLVGSATRAAITVFLTGPSNLDRCAAMARVNEMYQGEMALLDAALYRGPVAVHEEAASWTFFPQVYDRLDSVYKATAYILRSRVLVAAGVCVACWLRAGHVY